MESLPPFRESVGMGDHRDVLLCETISYLLCQEEGFLRRTPWERHSCTGRLSLVISSLPEQTAEGAEPAVRRAAPEPGNPSNSILPM